MNNIANYKKENHLITLLLNVIILFLISTIVTAQDFDFESLDKKVVDYTVIMEMKIELSFGMQSAEHEQRMLATIISDDGLIVFDGSFLSEDNPFSPISSFSFRITPTRIQIITLDGNEYQAEYIGLDRRTKLGFAQIINAGDKKFKPVRFKETQPLPVGSWLSTYMLLPEFVEPSLAADIGMISAHTVLPEKFTLTVGFTPMNLASPLYNENLQPIGLLGLLSDPSSSSADQGGLMESYGQTDQSLLGVIAPNRIKELIADPPQKGKIDRAWLGITLQALTSDIASFLNIKEPGGIIINEVIPESPADKSGLKIGDVIYQLNNQRIEVDKEENLSIFQHSIANMGAGATVEFSVYRPVDDRVDSLILLTELEAAPMAATAADSFESEDLEFTVRDLVFADFINYNIEQGAIQGVVVSELKQSGVSDIGGLRIGDVISRIGSADIENIADMEKVMEGVEMEKPSEIIFFVWRFGKTLFVNVKTDW